MYGEVESVCVSLKAGISGVEIDYEHIRFAGPPLWQLLFQLYQDFFMNHTFCESLLTGVILPLFKGKGPKQTIKIIVGVLACSPPSVKFMRWWLEKHAVDKGLFSDMQFGFNKGAGCTDASFTILETFNHMSEPGSKVCGVSLT